MNIPINRLRRDDEVYWAHEKKGIFIVKRAYKLGLSVELANHGATLDAKPLTVLWKSLWQCMLPPKVKISNDTK